jgi:hypothetical protein
MEYTTDGGTTWVKVTTGATSVDLTVLDTNSHIEVRVAAAGTALASTVQDLGKPTKAATPTTGTFAATSDTEGTLSSVDDTMEYTTDGGTSWTKVTAGATSVDLTGLTAGDHIEVRVAANGSVLASAAKDIATLTKATAPTTGTFAATSDTTGTLTGVTDTMEYTTDGGTNWIKVTTGATSVNLTGLDTTSHIEVRVAADGTKLASTAQDLGKPTQAVAPTTGTFAATSDTDGTLSGVDDTMEYTTDGGTTWTKVTTGATSVDLTGLTAGDHIEVRVVATGSVLASAAKDIATLTKATTPTTGTFAATSDTEGTLSGVDDTMEYTTDGGTTWVKVTTGATSVDLTGLTASSHIKVRIAATGSVLASTAKDVATLTKATAPTTGTFVATSDTEGTLSGVTDMMEYTTDGGTTWVKVTTGATSVDLTGLAAGDHIEVRVAAKGTVLASIAKDIATLTKAAAPTTGTFAATSDTTGTLTGVNDAMEYTTDGGATWVKITTGETSVDLTGLDTNSHIEVRVAADGTKLASTAQDLGKPTQATKPATGTFTATSDTEGTLSGIDDTMEYTTDGGTTWVKVTTGATSVDLTGLDATSHIEVRVAANGNSLASAAKDVATLTKAIAPTTGTFTATSDSKGTLTNVDTSMEYSLDSGATWHKVTSTSMDVSGVTTGTKIEVRTAANGTALASNGYVVATVNKANQPSTAEFTATSDSTGTLSGVDDTMEYSVDDGANWTKITSGTSVNVSVSEGDIIKVRVAAEGTMLASDSQLLGTVNKATTPAKGTFTATSDSTGTLTNVDTSMEYSLDSGATWNKVTATSMDVSSVVAGKDIEVRVASDGLTLASDSYKVASVTKGTTPSTASFIATSSNQGTITGLDNTMEYSLDGGTTWTKVTGTATSASIEAAVGTVIKVRTAANGNVLASDSEVLAPLTQASQPNSTYANEGVISGLSNYTSYVVTYVDAEGNSKIAIIVSSATGTITVNANKNSALFGSTITSIQVQASGSVLASPEQNGLSYEMKLTLATPTASYDSDTSVLSDLSEETNYKLTFTDGTSVTVSTKSGETELTLNTIEACLGKTIAGVSVLKKDDNYRDSAEEQITASKPIKFTYADPTPEVDIGKETITGLTPWETYVVSNGSDSAELIADETGSVVIPEKFIGTSVSVTHKSLDETKYISSKGVDVIIPSRATEPAATSLSYTALTDSTVEVTGVDSSMEYQIGTGEWKSVTGTSIVAPSGGDLHIRIKATSTTLASKEVSVKVPGVCSTPDAKVDTENDKLTGLVAGASYVIDGKTVTAQEDGTIAIDPSWYGKTIEIIAKGDGNNIDSPAQQLPIASIADQIAAYAAQAENEVTSAGSNTSKASDEVKAIVDKYVSEIEAIKSQALTKAEAKTAIDELKKEAIKRIEFQKEKEKVIAELQSLARDCQGKDKVQGYIDKALTEVGEKTYENSSISELEKIFTDTKEKVDLTLNQSILPNRLTTLATDLTDSYPYTDENKALIDEIIAEYQTKIASATSVAEQESLYTEAIDKIKSVQTGEVKTNNQGTSYPDGYDYQTGGLYGTVEGDGFDANGTLSASYVSEENGQSKLNEGKINKDYVGTVTLTSNEEVSSGLYKVKVLLPNGADRNATYKVIDKNGNIIEAKLDADGNLSFEASSLGEYQVVTDYQENHLLYVLIPLIFIILGEIIYAAIELNKIKKHLNSLDELDGRNKNEEKARMSILPFLGVMVLTNTTVVTLGTKVFIIVECIVILALAVVDFVLTKREKSTEKELDEKQGQVKAEKAEKPKLR